MCKKGLLHFRQELILIMKKTNAARLLDKLKIEYEIREYAVDENDLSAENVAQKVGMPLERVFKTLVARGDKNGVIMAVVSGAAEVDLKALASVSGNKKVEISLSKGIYMYSTTSKKIQNLSGKIIIK